MNKTKKDFLITRWAFIGLKRGLYNDTTLTVDEQCMSKFYATKMNELVYVFENNPFGGFMQNLMP